MDTRNLAIWLAGLCSDEGIEELRVDRDGMRITIQRPTPDPMSIHVEVSREQPQNEGRSYSTVYEGPALWMAPDGTGRSAELAGQAIERMHARGRGEVPADEATSELAGEPTTEMPVAP